AAQMQHHRLRRLLGRVHAHPGRGQRNIDVVGHRSVHAVAGGGAGVGVVYVDVVAHAHAPRPVPVEGETHQRRHTCPDSTSSVTAVWMSMMVALTSSHGACAGASMSTVTPTPGVLSKNSGDTWAAIPRLSSSSATASASARPPASLTRAACPDSEKPWSGGSAMNSVPARSLFRG